MSRFRTINRIIRFFRKVSHKFVTPKEEKGLISYSQCGEDLIINFIFSNLGYKKLSYLDLGAHHPIYLSNTYFFYKQGFSGLCVEPDPKSYTYLRKKRKRDICLNVGVGLTQQSRANFYVMTYRTLNTFSRERAEEYQRAHSKKIKIEEIVQIPIIPVNDLLNQYCTTCPDYVSLDIEGLEFEVLKSWNFIKFRPIVLCVETLGDKTKAAIISLLHDNQYSLYADTYCNSIFVASEYQ